jgi:hypothetical protein
LCGTSVIGMVLSGLFAKDNSVGFAKSNQPPQHTTSHYSDELVQCVLYRRKIC